MDHVEIKVNSNLIFLYCALSRYIEKSEYIQGMIHDNVPKEEIAEIVVENIKRTIEENKVKH